MKKVIFSCLFLILNDHANAQLNCNCLEPVNGGDAPVFGKIISSLFFHDSAQYSICSYFNANDSVKKYRLRNCVTAKDVYVWDDSAPEYNLTANDSMIRITLWSKDSSKFRKEICQMCPLLDVYILPYQDVNAPNIGFSTSIGKPSKSQIENAVKRIEKEISTSKISSEALYELALASVGENKNGDAYQTYMKLDKLAKERKISFESGFVYYNLLAGWIDSYYYWKVHGFQN